MLSVNDFFSGGKITKKCAKMQELPLKSATNSDVDYILQFASPSDDCLATADVIMYELLPHLKNSSKRSDSLRFYLYLCHAIDDFACLELQY